jgi:hypothetical protein
MHIYLCLWFLMFAYITYTCLCLFIYLLIGYDISKAIFHWTTKYGRKGSVQWEFSAISGEEDLCI